MPPVKITVAGDFWDSQIYRGRLYLWDMNGALRIYNWDQLIDSISAQPTHLALTCAFTRGDYLYQGDWSLVFGDKDFRAVLERKFTDAARGRFEISAQRLKKHQIAELDNPFASLQDDSEIYSNRVYGLTDLGLSAVTTHLPPSTGAIRKRAKLISDCRGSSLSAKGRILAIASGSDGMLEVEIDSLSREPKVVVRRHTGTVNWAFASIYGSSEISGGFLAGFSWEEKKNRQFVRRQEEIVDAEEIFGKRGFSWGCQEKLYMALGNRLEIVRFTQSKLKDNTKQAFERLPGVTFLQWKGAVTGGGTSLFGTVVELENALVVVSSDDDTFTIRGPIARWRVFPRSDRYQNHLHVIREDHLTIYSFNQDYFVNQEKKVYGITYRPQRRRPIFNRGVSSKLFQQIVEI